MIIARWHIEAKFGHKQDVIDSLKQWYRDIGAQAGWTKDRVRLLTGAVGAKEALIVAEVALDDMTQLDESFKKLGTIEAHQRWSRELEPYMVSGSTYWTVYRVLAD